jgi:hypothetical protein
MVKKEYTAAMKIKFLYMPELISGSEGTEKQAGINLSGEAI